MRTLTITEAKKNLGKWLEAARRGEEIGIIAGNGIFALRQVMVEPTDYAWREYGATREELESFETRVNAEAARLRRKGKSVPVPENLEEALENIAGLTPGRAKAAARAARARKSRRAAGAA